MKVMKTRKYKPEAKEQNLIREMWNVISTDRTALPAGLFMWAMAIALPYALHLIAIVLPWALGIWGLVLFTGGAIAHFHKE